MAGKSANNGNDGLSSEATGLIDSILGPANPGDSGNDDEGGGNDDGFENEDPDTGAVINEGDQDEGNQDEDEDDQDEEDAGDDDSSGNDDDLGRSARTKQPKQAAQKPQGKSVDPFDVRAQLQKDKAGNLYIAGQLIAKAGREARIYMGFRKAAQSDRKAAQQLAQHVTKIATGARELFTRYDELQKHKTAFETAGITPTEQSQILQVAAAYKKNPLDGIKLLLTQAHLAGVDIKSITGAQGALDPKVLMDQMTERMAGLLKPVTDETSLRANQNSIKNEAAGFFERNPRAKAVAKAVGGSHRLGLLLKEAKERAPDLPLDELFQRLDYMLLSKFGGKLPTDTGPVTRKQQPNGRQKRRMNQNFKRSLDGSQSYDDIAASVLRDAQLAESRGQ